MRCHASTRSCNAWRSHPTHRRRGALRGVFYERQQQRAHKESQERRQVAVGLCCDDAGVDCHRQQRLARRVGARLQLPAVDLQAGAALTEQFARACVQPWLCRQQQPLGRRGQVAGVTQQVAAPHLQ